MRSDISNQDGGSICSEKWLPGGGKRSPGKMVILKRFLAVNWEKNQF
jgi:hypothetical protein